MKADDSSEAASPTLEQALPRCTNIGTPGGGLDCRATPRHTTPRRAGMAIDERAHCGRENEDAHLKISAHALLHLLHQPSTGTLATHARDPHGFPYPTLLPFAPDARHRPVILVSRLAEHTRNLHGDPRAGFLVAHASDGNVLEGQRATLLGLFEPVEDGAGPDVARRYLRYQPDARRYLALGDFTFWVMHVERVRYIGGFGAMGWLDGAELDSLEPLSPAAEDDLLRFFEAHPARTGRLVPLGVDRYGADLTIDGARTRFEFDGPKLDDASLRDALAECIGQCKT